MTQGVIFTDYFEERPERLREPKSPLIYAHLSEYRLWVSTRAASPVRLDAGVNKGGHYDLPTLSGVHGTGPLSGSTRKWRRMVAARLALHQLRTCVRSRAREKPSASRGGNGFDRGSSVGRTDCGPGTRRFSGRRCLNGCRIQVPGRSGLC